MTAKKARVDRAGAGAVAEPRGAAYLTLMASILPADPTLDEIRAARFGNRAGTGPVDARLLLCHVDFLLLLAIVSAPLRP